MITEKIDKYLKVWWMMSKNSFIRSFASKLSFFIFFIGKVLRFGFFLFFLVFLLRGTDALAGYTVNQVIIIYLTFSLIDIVGQFLYREVYRFRPLVVQGDLDLVLTKPIKPLFRALMGGADFIDLITIPPLIYALIYFGLQVNPYFYQAFLYVLLVVNGLLIATAFHIAILAFAVKTYELDNIIWIYRDLLNLGRLPIEIYAQPLRGVLVYLIPVATMISVPAKSLFGIFTVQGVFISLFIGIASIFLSFFLWNRALRSYSSASS